MVIVLFAALIAPWFINWNDYKANFEVEAERILGQPVRVDGSADARILPSPSLTFTDVKVGDTEGQPMMSVERFSVTIELMPLLQGEIHVVSMKLERPVARVSIDDSGLVDWLIRTESSKTLIPDNVILENVEITDGTVHYMDASSGVNQTFANVQAAIEARSLAGPWRIDGSYIDDGVPVQFGIATGRLLDDGSIRVKTDFTPARLPLAIVADGVFANGDDGLSYAGTYNLTQIVQTPEEGEPGDMAGWRSDGSFTLTRDRLVVDRAVLSEGPPDRPSSLAGAVIIELGENARFSATAEARQLDLDRSLGKGPKEPVEVGKAAARFVDWLAALPVPGIPGTVRVNIPGIVVGGAVIQDVGFQATSEDGGWQIEELHARLPGQSTIDADGTLSTGEKVGFGGRVRLTVGQPATFASWWRGRGAQGAGRLLSPFELSGRATLSLGGLSVEDMETTIGDATISGSFSWSDADATSRLRRIRTDLKADRVDFVQVKALAELLAGKDLSDATALADSYAIKLAAEELAIEDIVMRGVAVDASLEDGALTVSGVDVADIGGARFIVTRGKIDNVLTDPKGRLEAQLTASSVAGIARVIDRLFPDTAFARWVTRAAPSLSPASVTVEIDSGATTAQTTSRLTVKGSAAATNFDATIDLAGSPASWRNQEAKLSASLSSYDAIGLARQAGVVAAEVDLAGGARIGLQAAGTPAGGMEASVEGSFGGISFSSSGALVLPADLPPTFKGIFHVETADLDPLIRMVGLAIPGAATGTPIKLDGNLTTLGPTVALEFANGEVAGRLVGGTVRLTENVGALSLGGSLQVDEVDLGWVASLGLGFAPLPRDDPESPWSKTPFGEPVFAATTVKFDVAAERLYVGDTLQVTSPKLTVALAPNRVDFDVLSGEVIGGSVVGGLSIRNVGGNANVTGRLSMVGGSLESVIWQRSGRSVATGTLDLSTNFEATGRSPAGLISSLTGGGTLALHDGEIRYVNPRAVNLVIRASDLGQQFTEEALAELFRSYIDAGSLSFTEAETAFSIAAGTVRIQNLGIDTADAKVTGSAAIDFNTMTLDSDWSLTLDPGGVKSDSPPPQVGIVFRGPIAEPSRIVDVLQFNSYLNIRQEERIQEILALEEEARLEKEMLNRERRKLREDAARREAEAQAAREARLAALEKVETFHNEREIRAEERTAAELAAAIAAEEEAAAAKAAAEKAATDAAVAAVAVRAKADAAKQVAEERAVTTKTLLEAAAKLTTERVAAEAEAKAAADRALEAERLAGEATVAGAAKSATLAAAQAALEQAARDREAAVAAAKAAEAKAAAALEYAEKAEAAAKVLAGEAATARQSATDNEAAAKAAAELAGKATEDSLAAETQVTARSAVEKAAAEVAAKAKAELAAAEQSVKAARDAADKAAAERDAAVQRAAAAAKTAETTPAAETAARAAAEAAAGKAVGDEAAALQAELNLKDAEALAAGTGGVGNEALVTSARADALAMRKAADESARRAKELSAAAEEAAASAKAAATAAAEAKRDADEKSAAAVAAEAKAKEAKVNAEIKVASADAARIAAEEAAAEAARALAAAKDTEAALEASKATAASLQSAASKAAIDADAAAVAADTVAEEARAARAAAERAVAEQAAAGETASAKATAEEAAALALDTAETERGAAEVAAGVTAEQLAAAKQATDAAAKVVADKARVEKEALGAAEEAAAAEAIAQKASLDAEEAARAAEAAAEAAAAKAASMSRVRLPGGAANASTAPFEPVAAAVEDAPLTDLTPVEAIEPLTPVEGTVPFGEPPRPKPRPTPPVRLPPALPTNDQPLVITPVP